jgi:chromate reductase
MMETLIHILGISGSLRRYSTNTGLLYAAQELAAPHIQLEIFNLAPIPLYNADVQALGDPRPVALLKERVAEADALLIATPEYNYSISGVLKNAIDWVSRPPAESPLRDKPLAIIGAGGMFGTLRAQNHLRDIAVGLNMHPLNHPQLMVQRAWEKFDKQGNLQDEETRQRLAQLLEALEAWTLRLREREFVPSF